MELFWKSYFNKIVLYWYKVCHVHYLNLIFVICKGQGL